MKYKEFKKLMKKTVFTPQEAQILDFKSPASQVNLQLHQWAKRGDLISLCRGHYAFPEITDPMTLVKYLYPPAYLSLESALNHYGLIPDIPFGLTLVTTRTTRHFQIPFGHFYYHRIQPDFFWGYDTKTLIGEREKVLLDYCYLNSAHLEMTSRFWQEFRLQNLDQINFKRLKSYAKRFDSKKILGLIYSIEEFAQND